MRSVPTSNRFRHMLRDSLLQSLGSTAHVPTIAVAQVLVNNIAFVRSRQYIFRGCREKLSGGKDNSRFFSLVDPSTNHYRVFLYVSEQHFYLFHSDVFLLKTSQTKSFEKMNVLLSAKFKNTYFYNTDKFPYFLV